MHVPPVENLKVVRYAEGFGYSAQEWEAALRAVDWTGGGAEPLKFGAKCSVWRATVVLGGRPHDCVLKVEPLDSFARRAKAMLGWTKAHRQWRGAEILRRAGISAAECCAVLRSPALETLVTSHATGPTLLERLAEPMTISEEQAVCNGVAAHLARCWKGRVYNHDGKPSNLLLDPSAFDGVRVLDTMAIDTERWDGLVQEDFSREMITALCLEPMGCSVMPRRSACMRFLHALASAGAHDGDRTHRHQLWRDVVSEIESHGDPTPRDNPLERPSIPPSASSSPPRS